MEKKNVLVIGSGPGGATVAKEMAQKGHHVTIIEWGKDNSPTPGVFPNPFRLFGGIKNKSNVFLHTDGSPSVEVVRPITLGGATLVYSGIAWEPPLDLFKQQYGIDLKNEVEYIKQEIIVKPLEDWQMGPAGKLIRDSAIKLGLHWKKIDRLFKDPEKFRQTSYLFGDKTGARWDARMWIKDAVANGAVLYNETYCEKLIIENGKVMGVMTADAKGRKKKHLSDIVIVAAGGIGSPMLLQNSGIEAGKNIFVDPYTVAIGYLDRKIMKTEVTRQSGILMKEEGISLGDASIPFQAYNKLILSNKKIDKIFKRNQSISISVEINDDPSGEITSTGKIKKNLSENDFQKLEKGKKIAKEILETAGAKDIWFTRIAGVHPGGGCKIGSVVDENLSTSIKNLYVCDASVLPEAFAIPPVLSILALGKRLASHLESEITSH